MTDFRARAACLDLDSELFFPAKEGGELARQQTIEAKTVCAGCPVTVACLAFALRTGQEHGVYGGLDALERQELHQQMRGTRSRVETYS